MKHLRRLIGSALCLAVFAIAGCGRKSTSQVVGESPVEQSPSMPSMTLTQSPTAVPSITPSPEAKPRQIPSSDLAKLETRVRPSVIWMTVFDLKGNLLRTQSGFFISPNGRFVTTARAIEGGINAVAKTGDGGIYNVGGILATSTTLDLAILQADVKRVPFLALNKNGNLPLGTQVGVVGSGLAGSEGNAREAAITTQQSDRLEVATAISPSSIGSPLVDANGEVVGVVISTHENCIARPASAITSLQSQIASDAKARWPDVAETRPTPRPTPKPRLVYAPPPTFPPEAYSRPGSRSGRFRLNFNAKGNVTNIQIIQSTGNDLLDRAATDTLRQWKSAPGQEWVATVPITFQGR